VKPYNKSRLYLQECKVKPYNKVNKRKLYLRAGMRSRCSYLYGDKGKTYMQVDKGFSYLNTNVSYGRTKAMLNQMVGKANYSICLCI